MRDPVRYRGRRRTASLAIGVAAVVALFVVVCAVPAAASPPGWSHAGGVRVLRVGSWHGIRGQYSSIQSAVNVARPGDWVLVAPGDYHESGSASAGVMITTPDLHVRGLDRNGVVIDGTRGGAAKCSSETADQVAAGRNGIEVFEANGVTLENLTACNFLRDGDGGNQIWWNGGDGTGTQNLASFGGAYLSATSTFWQSAQAPRAEYGIFVSNTIGPGTIAHTYASNMADSDYYVGACPNCNTVLDDAHAQYSALGYSGTNSGGNLVIRNSEFDHNNTGVSTNSQNNDDAPSPQDGVCPNGSTGPTRSRSCWSFTSNFVHDNNNVSVPRTGSAALGPPGTGLVIAGGRTDTVTKNHFSNNGSWAVLLAPFLDLDTPPPVAHCEGGIDGFLGGCYYGDWGNEVASNTFDNSGGFGNPTNGDLADLSDPHDPGNCWHDNTDPSGISSAPADLQITHAVCGIPNAGEAVLGSELSNQVLCATELLGPCDVSVGNYPHGATVVMPPLAPQSTMSDPCAGVPANAWCPGGNNRN
jgi:hypothetical protein